MHTCKNMYSIQETSFKQEQFIIRMFNKSTHQSIGFNIELKIQFPQTSIMHSLKKNIILIREHNTSPYVLVCILEAISEDSFSIVPLLTCINYQKKKKLTVKQHKILTKTFKILNNFIDYETIKKVNYCMGCLS